MDYRPNLMARGISTGKTGTLGLLTYEISHEPSSRQTDQILRAADRQNYQIVMGLATNRLHMARLDNQIKHIKQLLSPGHRRTVDSYAGRPR